MTIVQLGKFGDIVNVLPLAFMLSKKLGGRIKWLVGKNWESTLEGVSYVEPIIFDGTDDQLGLALHMYKGQKLVTQSWQNPDPRRETDSFAKEQWRYAGVLDERGKWPLVFDQRNKERELKLCDKLINKRGRPVVLCSTRSVSTPYKNDAILLSALGHELDADVVDISWDCAERIYDLIALYDAADLLVTVDTCHAHLARASYCPVIVLQNDGWMGMNPPPPQTIANWRYRELGDDLSPVVAAAKTHLSRKTESVAVICYSFNPDERTKRAMATHPENTRYCRFTYRPSLKQMLVQGLNAHKDVVVFTNDDVTFMPDTLDKIKWHAQKFDFGCSRRPRDPVHIGREIFWFRDDWLRKNWYHLPNPYWACQKGDLILCRWMRHLQGIPTTLENLNYDFPPVDVPDVIYHEDHESHWNKPEILASKEGLYNEHLFEKGV